MSELSSLRGSEGYGACDDETGKRKPAADLYPVQLKLRYEKALTKEVSTA